MRILIIEDDEKLCEAMRFALEMEGYIADVCHDGDDGFRWAREQAHDLILLDRMLPSTDGVELLKRLRAQGHTYNARSARDGARRYRPACRGT